MSTKKRGPSLPKSLLDHIHHEESSGVRDATQADPVTDTRRNKSNKAPSSRKDVRKQGRLDRKKRRADHFSASRRRISDEEHVPPVAKRRKTVHFAEEVKSPSPPRKETHDVEAHRLFRSKPNSTPLEKLASQSTRKAPKLATRTPQSREEAEEDAYIAYLEAKLGYANGSKRKSGDEADGLGDLLDFTNGLEISLFRVSEHSGANSDLELSKDLGSHMSDDGKSPEIDQTSDNSRESSQTKDKIDKLEEEESGNEDEWSGLGTDDNELSQYDQVTRGIIIRESEAQSSGRYIPPGLREEVGGDELTGIIKLTRQLKGLINRLSEQNISSVLDGIEEVYRKYRRHDITSTLTTLIIDGISSHAILLDSFVVLHAAFISGLHRLIGIESAAFIVQNIVSAYERHLLDYEGHVSETAHPEERGKECSNLIVFLSELYNFQVISCILLYDIIRGLLDKTLSEFRVELLLKILRSSGQQLRQDDPSALKDIVTLAQSAIANQSDNLSSRTKFMVETLINLKNNKMKKSATQHQDNGAVERMKKFLSNLGKKRHVQAHEALRISLSDLHSAETKGKWWLVGAAWAGDPLVDQQHHASAMQNEGDTIDINNTALVKLARRHGMNTDIRRSVFAVLMSSDDCLDACERLAQLNLSEVQQREIVRVILHCCGNEKSYNPYYALVCQQLCRKSHAHKITLQFCLWDFLRDMGETSVCGAEVVKNLKGEHGQFQLKVPPSLRMKNTAKAYGWWIAKDCCSITILKPIDFTALKPQAWKFLRELFIQIFTASQASAPVIADSLNNKAFRNREAVEEVFIKATKIENLGLGLIFYLTNTFKGEEGLIGWACAVAKETLQTGMNEVPRL